jgi:hypothetical protein
LFAAYNRLVENFQGVFKMDEWRLIAHFSIFGVVLESRIRITEGLTPPFDIFMCKK